MNIANRIKSKRIERGLTQQQLAKLAGIKQPSLNAIETGKAKNMRASTLEGIAKALKVTPEWITSGVGIVSEPQGAYSANIESVPSVLIKKVPVIDMVAAGDWMECADPYAVGHAESWEVCPVPHGENTFAVLINGESMMPKFQHGEIIFCDPCKSPVSGDYVIAKLTGDNQATFKQLVIEDGKHMLKALNPSWPQRYTPINGNCHIVGKVIARLEKF